MARLAIGQWFWCGGLVQRVQRVYGPPGRGYVGEGLTLLRQSPRADADRSSHPQRDGIASCGMAGQFPEFSIGTHPVDDLANGPNRAHWERSCFE
jgi:hypothetical protein